MNAIEKITEEILQRIQRISVITSMPAKGKKTKRVVKLSGRHSLLSRKKIAKTLTGRKLDEIHKKAISQAMSQQWQVTSPAMKTHVVFNLKAFCWEKGLNYSAMVNVAGGRLKQHQGGWTCKRIE